MNKTPVEIGELAFRPLATETPEAALSRILEDGILKVNINKKLPKPDLLKKVTSTITLWLATESRIAFVKYLDPEGMNRQERTRRELKQTRMDFQRHEHDTGSPEVQGRVMCVCDVL